MKCKNCQKEQEYVFCSEECRFLYKTIENPQSPLLHNSHCLEWSGYINNVGYGFFHNKDGGSRLAHRKSFSLFCNDIPDGYVINHKCHNHCCVNPDHLEAVTPEENLSDKRHNNRRMTYETVDTIRERNLTAKDVVKEYGVSLLAAQRLVRGLTYKHN